MKTQSLIGKGLIVGAATLLLAACQSVGHQKPTEVQEALNEAYTKVRHSH